MRLTYACVLRDAVERVSRAVVVSPLLAAHSCCTAGLLDIDWHKNKIPDGLTDTHYTACIHCDDRLSSMISGGKSRMRHPM